jgi:hypothetical protein
MWGRRMWGESAQMPDSILPDQPPLHCWQAERRLKYINGGNWKFITRGWKWRKGTMSDAGGDAHQMLLCSHYTSKLPTNAIYDENGEMSAQWWKRGNVPTTYRLPLWWSFLPLWPSCLPIWQSCQPIWWSYLLLWPSCPSIWDFVVSSTDLP